MRLKTRLDRLASQQVIRNGSKQYCEDAQSVASKYAFDEFILFVEVETTRQPFGEKSQPKAAKKYNGQVRIAIGKEIRGKKHRDTDPNARPRPESTIEGQRRRHSPPR